MFENLFAGFFEDGELKAGKFTIAMGGKVVQTIEGVIDVPCATDPVAPEVPIQRVEESKAQPEQTKESKPQADAAPVNNGK